MARSFAGKTVLITGAGGGLGRALALRFAAAGSRLALLDRDEIGLAETAALVPAGDGALASAVCDVAQPSECEQAVRSLREALGPIDVLVANAGISHRSAFARTDPAVIRRVMEVNFFGALHCTHAVLPDVIARRGMIIAISSVAGFAPLIARTGYAASKHALHGFYDSLRSEIEPAGARVLLVCPSFIQTGIDRHALGGDGQPARHRQIIVGARARAEQVAERIHAAAAAERRLLLHGRTAHLAWWVSRLAPGLYARMMARHLAGEMSAD